MPLNIDEADAVAGEVKKLDDLEVDVTRAFNLGTVGGKELTSAQMVALISERRRIIELRSTLLGLIAPEVEAENGH